jgi:hypothetical protein
VVLNRYNRTLHFGVAVAVTAIAAFSIVRFVSLAALWWVLLAACVPGVLELSGLRASAKVVVSGRTIDGVHVLVFSPIAMAIIGLIVFRRGSTGSMLLVGCLSFVVGYAGLTIEMYLRSAVPHILFLRRWKRWQRRRDGQ